MGGETFEWYYVGTGGQIGPLSESQMVDLASHAVIQSQTLVWKPGMEQWTQAGSIPLFASKIQPVWTPPAQSAPPPVPAGSSSQPTARAICPRDGAPLRHEVKDGVEIDACPQCRGVWLDRGELERLTRSERDFYRRDDDDDDDDRRQGRRRGGFLDNVFDVFD